MPQGRLLFPHVSALPQLNNSEVLSCIVSIACCAGSPFPLKCNPKARKEYSDFYLSAYNFVQIGSDHHANMWGSAHHCGKKNLGKRNRLRDDFIFLQAFIGAETEKEAAFVVWGPGLHSIWAPRYTFNITDVREIRTEITLPLLWWEWQVPSQMTAEMLSLCWQGRALGFSFWIYFLPKQQIWVWLHLLWALFQ